MEALGRELLHTQNYDSIQEVRLTGVEVDLLATEKTTGERILVECKAHRANIPAEVLSKLIGSVTFKSLAGGWLVSTSPLSKDAKGLEDEWQQRPPEQRRQLQIYGPVRLIERLISARVVVSPDALRPPTSTRLSNDAYLLVTPRGNFWALATVDGATGLRGGVLVFEAATGNPILSRELLEALARTDSSLSSLNWHSPDDEPVADSGQRIQRELQNIVRVPSAENWVDYRPARPEDFVGRDQLQKSVFDFFDRVRNGESHTRLLAIKGPSGWGKSSCVLKLAATAAARKNTRGAFVFAVDSRAATSRRFGELALQACLAEASRTGFVRTRLPVAVGGPDNPLSTPSMREIQEYLEKERKVVCLIFDQFEELLFKQELEAVFDDIRILCDALDEAQANIIIGFSWKTDGTIPTEHKAYHLWHSLSDRRLEFELRPFNANEVASALNKFEKVLGQRLAPQLRRLLQDHGQGFPWLLKKLCIHVLEQVQSGHDQNEVLDRALSIGELFARDIQRLGEKELECIRRIAQEAPAEFFKITNVFGDEVVALLLDKRLIIRSGTRLSIYWDIFRDYLLTKRVPYIPVTYIPVANFGLYSSSLKFLLTQGETTYEALQQAQNVAAGTADNIVRDLVMVGHAEANRRSATFKPLHTDEDAAAKALVAFWRSHVVFLGLVREAGPDAIFQEGLLRDIVREAYSNVDEGLADNYTQRIARWLVGVGLLDRVRDKFLISNRSIPSDLFDLGRAALLRRGTALFVGEAPPMRVVDGVDRLSRGAARQAIEEVCGRNAFVAMMNLGIVGPDGNPLVSDEELGMEPAQLVEQAALETSTVSIVLELLKRQPKAAGEEVGDAVATAFELQWSSGSKKRNGAALKQWAEWCTGARKNKSSQGDLF